jgi:peptide methionine sulfoxide reductase MsrA
MNETAILAGGCFWGVQELLRHRDGVISRVGHTGGEHDDPTEADPRDHAEAVEVVFDPERLSYIQHHPDGEICHCPRPGWKLPHREPAV